MTSKTYRLSPTFCRDHWERDCGETDKIVKEGKYCVYVQLDADGYADMLSDADLYSDHTHFDPPADFYKLAQSAKRVAKVLRAEGPPEPAATKPDPATVSDSDVKWTRFGWCSFGPEVAHDQCRVEFFSTFDNTMHKCKCDCHQGGAEIVQW